MKKEKINMIDKIDLYLKYVRGTKSIGTYNNYKRAMRFWEDYCDIFHSQNLLNIFLENEKNKHLLSKGKIQTLKSFFNWLGKRYPQISNVKYVEYFPSNKLKKEKVYKNLDIDEIHIIIDTIIEKTSPKLGLLACFYIYFQYYSGLRIAELFENKIEEFVPNTNYNKFKIVGKGNKERSIFVSDRRLPFTFKPPYNTIIWFREIFYEVQRIKKNNGGKYIWKQVLYKSLIERANEWCKEKEKNFPHFTTHYFRHSFAYRLIDTGTPIVAVQWFMGHTNLATTAQYIEFPYNDLEYYYKLSDISLIKSLDISVYKDREKTYRRCIFKLAKVLQKYEKIDIPQFLSDEENYILDLKEENK